MSYNKVQFGDQTLIDLTKDSVTPQTLARGATAHDAAGNTIIGTAIGASLIAEQSDNGVRITATDHNGTTTATIFHGEKGSRGTGILQVTTEPEKYTGPTSGIQPIGRMLLSDLMSQAGVSEVLAGDCILHSYMLYHIYYTDDAYAYIDVSHSLRDGNGLGAQAASLLIEVLRSAVYNTDQSAYIDALEAALCGGTVPDLPDIPDTPDVPDEPDEPAEAVTFAQTGENSVTVSGVVFEQQEEGTVLWRGATFTPGEGNKVVIK